MRIIINNKSSLDKKQLAKIAEIMLNNDDPQFISEIRSGAKYVRVVKHQRKVALAFNVYDI